MQYFEGPGELVYDHIVDFITNSIVNTQFGFVHNRSTLQQLLVFINNLIKALNNKAHTDAIYLDLRKAFDSVPHNELLVKLWSYGITGHLWEWFKFYLSNRSQIVRINHQYFNALPVLSGVPQGEYTWAHVVYHLHQ